MNSQQSTQFGALALRVGLGIIFLAHSAYLKLIVFTLPGTAQYFGSVGLPEFLAYVVFVMEVGGGLALIAGAYTRVASLALVPVALGATWVHLGAGWVFSNEGGGWEFPLFLALALVVQSLLGDGAFALRRSPKLETANA